MARVDVTRRVVTTAVAVMLAACGPASTVARSVPTTGVDPNQAAGQREAVLLLSLLAPPSTWVPVGSPPAPALATPPQQPASPDLDLATKFWVAPGSWSSVNDWVSADTLPGLVRDGGGQDSDRTGATVMFVSFSAPPAGNFDQRTVLVATAPTGDGKVGVRADAEVLWLPSRPSGEKVPAAEPSLTLSVSRGIPAATTMTKTFTDRATIDRIATDVNTARLADPGPHGCTADNGLRLTAVFTGPGSTITVTSNPACLASTVTIDGQSEPVLQLGPLADDEAAALGTTLEALRHQP